MKTITKGNPFTHYETERTSYTRGRDFSSDKTCDWCGQKPRALYSYNRSNGLFCNQECWGCYYGL